jgi:hypothetical protein
VQRGGCADIFSRCATQVYANQHSCGHPVKVQDSLPEGEADLEIAMLSPYGVWSKGFGPDKLGIGAPPGSQKYIFSTLIVSTSDEEGEYEGPQPKNSTARIRPRSHGVSAGWLHARWPAGGESLFDGHWAQAVIQTSVKGHEYLAGRHRQAVRTNIRRAQELGITATRLGGYDEFAAASAPVYRSRSGGDAVLAATRKPPPSDEFAWYSIVARGVPITVAAVALFGDFAVLAAHGIRQLVVGSVLRESDGNQYFQRLLGFAYATCNRSCPPRSGTGGGMPPPRCAGY